MTESLVYFPYHFGCLKPGMGMMKLQQSKQHVFADSKDILKASQTNVLVKDEANKENEVNLHAK